LRTVVEVIHAWLAVDPNDVECPLFERCKGVLVAHCCYRHKSGDIRSAFVLELSFDRPSDRELVFAFLLETSDSQRIEGPTEGLKLVLFIRTVVMNSWSVRQSSWRGFKHCAELGVRVSA
jgi:hypothetical protein